MTAFDREQDRKLGVYLNEQDGRENEGPEKISMGKAISIVGETAECILNTTDPNGRGFRCCDYCEKWEKCYAETRDAIEILKERVREWESLV